MGPRICSRRFWRSLITAGLAAAILLSASCGAGYSVGGGTVGGGPPPPDTPTLVSISPTSATAGTSAVGLTLTGSNFSNTAVVQWNGSQIPSTWMSSTLMTASVPSNDVAAAGSAKVTVTNLNVGGGTSAGLTFMITATPSASTWVRNVAGITAPQDIVWDAAHGMLYVSNGSSAMVSPNTIIPINPMTGSAGTPVPAGNNPHLLSISSDFSYLWTGLDGDNSVERFLLPGLTNDIAFPVPLDYRGNPQQPVNLWAAPVSPHALALIAGQWGYSPPGAGVYVYDDATRRPTSVPGFGPGGGPMIDWIQWGADDSTIYGNQYTTIDAGGVATLSVDSSGVSLTSYNGGQIGPAFTQYDKANGLLYSFGGAFEPANGSLVGTFDFLDLGQKACTFDVSLGRYYCVVSVATYPTSFELWVYDMQTYALLDRVSFGWTAGIVTSPITGDPTRLVRWGNSGLAVITSGGVYSGNGGVFLVDGAAINPNAAPDVTSGIPSRSNSWIASLKPEQTAVGSGSVALTIKGNHFTQDSTACWNCSFLQFQFLPTIYASSQELSVSIPANFLASPTTQPITVFDSGTNLFSTDTLNFTVAPSSSGGTKFTALNLSGLAMAWDANSALLYVGISDDDGAYPNSIAAVNPENGSVVKAQTVSPDPYLVSISTNGQYLYAGFINATTMTQLQLPSLGSPLTWTLNSPGSTAVYTAGDIKPAPVDPHTTAVTLFNLQSTPWELGGVVIYDDGVQRANFVNGWNGGKYPPTIYDTLAWGSADQVLTGACSSGCLSNTPFSPLYDFQVTKSGAAFIAAGTPTFSMGEIHSDFGTGLIYSDDGKVADPSTQAVVGTYNGSGLVAPDSSLNRVFILGQTAAQANTNNYTIASFDEKAYTFVSSITVEGLVGAPIQLIRWGTSGLALLTHNFVSGSGMLYLIQDATFVSALKSGVSNSSRLEEMVQQRWKRFSKADVHRMVQARGTTKRP